MLTLSQLQRKFMRELPRLLDYLHEQGYECTAGDAYRDPRVHGAIGVKLGYGHPKSGHKNRLAIDINLFKDGVYLIDTEAYRPAGEWWEAQAEENRWGGRFDDGNHFSKIYNGVM